jgi:hypothetical protein
MPFGTTEVPLQDGILEELLSFCFFVPQHPAAIVFPIHKQLTEPDGCGTRTRTAPARLLAPTPCAASGDVREIHELRYWNTTKQIGGATVGRPPADLKFKFKFRKIKIH